MQVDMTWNLFVTPIMLVLLGWAGEQVYKNLDQSIRAFKAEAEERNRRTEGKLDALITCMTNVKVELEDKVDRDKCDELRREYKIEYKEYPYTHGA